MIPHSGVLARLFVIQTSTTTIGTMAEEISKAPSFSTPLHLALTKIDTSISETIWDLEISPLFEQNFDRIIKFIQHQIKGLQTLTQDSARNRGKIDRTQQQIPRSAVLATTTGRSEGLDPCYFCNETHLILVLSVAEICSKRSNREVPKDACVKKSHIISVEAQDAFFVHQDCIHYYILAHLRHKY